jgi:ADP-ribose pyrophosphatase YjhB (NUDIX family)
MTMVGELFAAINRDDLDRVARMYAADCDVELVFADDEPLHHGRAAVASAWERERTRSAGALPGGRRYDVSRIAGIETGWGWVRADFVRGLRHVATGAEVIDRGYSYFWIEDGAIRRQRTILRAPERGAEALRSAGAGLAEPAPQGRRYPARPVLGVGGVIFNDRGEVLLVKRRHEPLALQWSLPGGGLDSGETLEAGTAREIKEETGLIVEVGPLIEVFDRILLDEDANVRYHFVLVDYLCRPIGGVLDAQSDVSECAWVALNRLAEFSMAEKPRDVILRAAVMRESLQW